MSKEDDKDKFSLEKIGVLEGHGGAVTSLVCGEENGVPLLISGSRDKSIIKWQLHLNEPKEVIIRLEDEEVEEGQPPKEIKKYIVGKPLKSFHGHNHFVSCLALNSDSTKLVSGSWDKTIRLWDIPTVKSNAIFKGHTKDILCIAFSHDERLIFSGGMDNTLRYWNTKGELKYENNQFKGWVSCILNISKGKQNYIAVGSWDGSVKILNSEYNIHREIPGGEYAVTSISTDDQGDYLFIAYKNGTIKVMNFEEKESESEVKQTIETGIDINAILFESKFFQIYALGTSKGLQIRRIKGSKKPDFEDNENGACLSLAYDKSKDYLFAGFADGTIKVYKTLNEGEN
jgi:guanine nucleotide-binding protein subunit beta-2-like 1 protein